MVGFGGLPTSLRLSTERLTKKKRKQTHRADHEQHVERSTTATETDIDNEQLPSVCGGGTQHQRNLSLHVMWTLDDIRQIAREIYDGTVADVHLSLFAYWVQEKNENYDLAKEYVRELSLDQGYNIDRIGNRHLRKLLEDTCRLRPRKPKFAKTIILQANMSTPSRTSPASNTFITSPLTSGVDTLAPPLRAKREHHTEEAAHPNSVSHSNSDYKDYPPNTPDRPAPLTLRSRSSRASSTAQTSYNILRSVSSPIHNRGVDSILPPLPRFSTMFQDMESHPLLSPSPIGSFVASSEVGIKTDTTTDDVFGILDQLGFRQSKLLSITQTGSKNTRHSSHGRNPFADPCDPHCGGSFELDTADIASDSSYGSDGVAVSSFNEFDGTIHKNEENGNCANDETFGAMRSYTDLGDEISILESASSISDSENKAQYSYALSAPPPNPAVADPAPTPSQRRATLKARRSMQHPSLMDNVPNFHRPLPLRSYESEAHLYPTSRVQAIAPTRMTEGTPSPCSPVTEARYTGTSPKTTSTSFSGLDRNSETLSGPHDLIPLPPSLTTAVKQYPSQSRHVDCPQPQRIERRSEGTTGRSALLPLPPRSFLDNNSSVGAHTTHKDYTGIKHQNSFRTGRTSENSRRLSTASIIAAFPIPSMQDETDELPMAVSRATSSPELTTASTSIAEAYRAIAKAHITELLQQTRSRGTHLQNVDWNDLTPFERTWREVNEPLLVSIYGRRDVLLTDADVEYVDSIARGLREGIDATSSVDWLCRVFRDAV
ncbi:hypothetical protein P153DRAFT_44155 [Dothidotthia symphoricarpi CBS 119687]|uniref:Uncharacterized protein n=1 Tax=Dothidotthia symphoricarpi CBS 119687 TaxID=1392245 RepID=A0A6A6A7E2_9PLEO|nr:uncharacterized protein P153DRAFT_44155 [Dothidotthia symphoricarpi CBS 119687]KAF2127922.1 hypothetical protein P153DRAFT_44155 [Dothidotthia symphoricarpi CBS 119687]